MAKTTKTTAKTETNNDMENLRNDLHAVQKHLADLAKDVTTLGKSKANDISTTSRVKANEMKIRAQDNVSYMQDYGRDQYKHMEENIQANPGKSVAIAFTAGLLTSLLFSGRK